MTTQVLKKEIYRAIDNIDDAALLEAVFTILKKNLESPGYELSDADIKVIEERKALYESGKAKVYSVSEVKKKILKNLGK